MVFKTLLIVLVFAVLMEDSLSIKKTAEEEKEDREVAEKVNATLAEEEKKRQEEKEKKKDKTEIKKKEEENKGRRENKDEKTGEKNKADQRESQSEADSLNCTCPTVDPCPEERTCEKCPVCKECGKCPTVKPCQPCKPCGPCGPDTVVHNETTPSANQCPEDQGLVMTIPVAMAVGAAASFLVIGVATAVGLVIRYVPPTVSGFFFLSTIIIVWYLSSQYPAVAREMGERVVTVLREATVTLGNRVMAALQRHNEQVGFPVLSLIFSLE
jgi:hypothetical protein